MAYSGLSDFIADLERHQQLHRIKTFIDPVLEIAEIADRITKNGGKALLFENNGTAFPLLINAFGSDERMAMALSRNNIEEIGQEILNLFNSLTLPRLNLSGKLSLLPVLARLSQFMPARMRGQGICQQVKYSDPDLGILPVLKCWPYDGGRFITLPIVHTKNPDTGSTNAGMYRMQILNRDRAAIHWQRHKTGASHFGEWKKTCRRMPVTVTLGGDPVYTYAATAPLPENFDEYILAGFLRKKRVKLVKCITNDLFIPNDADFVIEGYVDPSEEFVTEGPFGDHTGFYSLKDLYPVFHVTCITHSEKAVYPATIVGIPPQEDAWLTKATEKIFFYPLKLTLQPEIEDLHMPPAAVAHNLAIVKIKKTYPGQGMKVLSSLLGAGQMMFTKYLVVVSGNVDIRNYRSLVKHTFENTDFRTDVFFSNGPLDILDHSSERQSFGGKLGIDGTEKMNEELIRKQDRGKGKTFNAADLAGFFSEKLSIPVSAINIMPESMPVMIMALNQAEDPQIVAESRKRLSEGDLTGDFRVIIAVDHPADVYDLFTVVWQVLGNTDPHRDIVYISDTTLYIDGTIKAFRPGGFPRKWPNVVCSSEETIKVIDQKWESLGIGTFIPSPSLKNMRLVHEGNDELIIGTARE